MVRIFAAILALSVLTQEALAEKAAQPSIVLILADDLGYGDLKCYGCPDINTPHLDNLAGQGVRCTQFYSNGPECSPTRTALLTGRYQQRVGGLECALGVGNVGRYDDAIRLAKAHDLGLPVEEGVLPRALKDAGYRTGIFGKWHLGYEAKFHPRRHGFDEFFGIVGGNADYFKHQEAAGLPVLYHNEKPIERKGYLTHLITDEALRFVRGHRDQPFFLYLTYTTPHSPYQGPGDNTGKLLSEEEWNKGTRAKYVEMVEDMDQQIGRVLRLLDELKLTDNTVVIFASDNGGAGLGRNDPFSGRKGGLLEGGIRAPLIVRWPGHIKAGTVSHQVGITMDLTVSLLRLTGAKNPPKQPLDGMDLLQHFEQDKAEVARTLFWRGRRGERTWRAVREGNWKYVQRMDGEKKQEWLFDLGVDVGEKNNLLEKRPEEKQRLTKKLAQWEMEVRPRR